MEFLKARNRGRAMDPHEAFERRFDKPAFFRRGDYMATIQQLDRAFPDQDRHYAFFEELFQSETLHAICAFADLDRFDFDVEANPNEGVTLDKPAPALWSRVRAAYAPIYDFVERRMGRLPEKWRT